MPTEEAIIEGVLHYKNKNGVFTAYTKKQLTRKLEKALAIVNDNRLSIKTFLEGLNKKS